MRRHECIFFSFSFSFRSISCHEWIIVLEPLTKPLRTADHVTIARAHKTQGLCMILFHIAWLTGKSTASTNSGLDPRWLDFLKKTVGNTEGARARLLIILLIQNPTHTIRNNNVRLKKNTACTRFVK